MPCVKVFIYLFLSVLFVLNDSAQAARDVIKAAPDRSRQDTSAYDSLSLEQKWALHEAARQILRREMVLFYLALSEDELMAVREDDFDFDGFFERDEGFNTFKFEDYKMKFDRLMSDWMVVSPYRRMLLQELGLTEKDVTTLRMLRRMLGNKKNIQLVDEDLRNVKSAEGCGSLLQDKPKRSTSGQSKKRRPKR
jgi:hypothetical protein